jgi:hypothetical protein
MKKANSIGPIIRMVVVCFLFFSFISTSFNLTSNGKLFIALFSIKKLKGPTHSDAGCPMEEAGKEVENRGEDKGNHNVLVLWSPQNFVVTLLLDTGQVRTLRSSPSYGDSSRVPLYLSNRTLLI